LLESTSLKHLFLIEAKGQTSSEPRTKRYGKEFNRNQKFDHVAKASYVAMRLQNEYKSAEIGIALPDDRIHTEYVNYILPLLRLLNIHVFLVDQNKAVCEH